MRRQLLAIAAALLLAACAAPPSQPPTASVAPSAAATPAPATAAPTAPGDSPTAAPTQPTADLLPAPLYVLELGQIARIERDGASRSLLTEERVQIEGIRPITEFALAADALAYVVGDVDADRLVAADAMGTGSRTLYSAAGHELSDPLFAPDGARVLFRLLNNRQPPDTPSGIYSIPLAGGEPALLRADDPVDDPVNPARSVSGYQPVAFSPDGAQLLVRVQSSFYEDCTLGVMPAAGGDVLRVAPPEGQQILCGEATWTGDGGLLLLAGPAGTAETGPSLWRADATTGVATPLLPDGLARAPAATPDGVRLFVVSLVRDAAGVATGATFQPAALTAGAATPTPLGEPFPELLERALWAPDGAGVVVELSSEERSSLLRWLPNEGDPVQLPSSEDGVVELAWGAT